MKRPWLRYNRLTGAGTLMKRLAARFSAVIGCALALNVIGGCAEEPPPAKAQPTEVKSSAWKSANGATVVSADDASDESLRAAIEQARKTAETARARWTQADDADRAHWAIKWAAPTFDQRIEYVWVRPVNWSPFRIEGVLMSQPVAELECGKREGELVSFAIEELADWVHSFDSPPHVGEGEFEGGFTVRVLEERFGKPPRGDER